MTGLRGMLLLAAIAFAAALAGVVAGRMLFGSPSTPENEIHALLHDGLDLDSHQLARIETLENRFAIERRALELELRTDNARLAGAIEAEHGYGPQVSAVVDQSHLVMGELQKQTLEHVFAMRAVLRPDQARKFDAAVVKALTLPAK